MTRNDIIAYFTLSFLAAGILTWLLCGLSASKTDDLNHSSITMPAEYKDAFKQAKTLQQEWWQVPSKARKKEIAKWCFESFMVPIRIVEKTDIGLATFIVERRLNYLWQKDRMKTIEFSYSQ